MLDCGLRAGGSQHDRARGLHTSNLLAGTAAQPTWRVWLYARLDPIGYEDEGPAGRAPTAAVALDVLLRDEGR